MLNELEREKKIKQKSFLVSLIKKKTENHCRRDEENVVHLSKNEKEEEEEKTTRGSTKNFSLLLS